LQRIKQKPALLSNASSKAHLQHADAVQAKRCSKRPHQINTPDKGSTATAGCAVDAGASPTFPGGNSEEGTKFLMQWKKSTVPQATPLIQ
jgi:hypothetical protein